MNSIFCFIYIHISCLRNDIMFKRSLSLSLFQTQKRQAATRRGLKRSPPTQTGPHERTHTETLYSCECNVTHVSSSTDLQALLCSL